MNFGTVTNRVDRGVQVLAEHGITLAQLDADRFNINNGNDCALGQAYDIIHPGEELTPGFYGGYGVLRDEWSAAKWFGGDSIEWANYHAFSPSMTGDEEALNAEWRTRIREARRGL